MLTGKTITKEKYHYLSLFYWQIVFCKIMTFSRSLDEAGTWGGVINIPVSHTQWVIGEY